MQRIGVDVGGTKVEAILIDANGGELARERVATPKFDYAGTVEVIGAIVEHLDRIAGATCAVGAGTPGALEPSTGLMKNCNSTWLNGKPLLADLTRRLGNRVRIANDADCFALSESVDGAGRAEPVVFGVILGTGVGGGVVVDGRLLRGANGIAGEWGHTPLPYFKAVQSAVSHQSTSMLATLESRMVDRTCYCGRSNCVETFLSGPGLAATHRELWGESKEAAAIAASSDSNCVGTIDLYCWQLARALSQIVNIIDPNVIVLGGGVSAVPHLYPHVAELWRGYVFSDRVVTRLLRAVHGPTSGVRGAAWLWPADYNLD